MRLSIVQLLSLGVVPLVMGCSTSDAANWDGVAGKGNSPDGGTGGNAGKPEGGLDGAAAAGGKKEGGTGGGAGALITEDGGGAGGSGGGDVTCSPTSQQDCYTGPSGTSNVGECKSGKQTCAADGKSWSACAGEILPTPDTCMDAVDNDCNGIVNDGDHTAPGCACTAGETKCENDHERTCNADGDWGSSGALCCKAGQFTCDCNQVMQCDVGPPPKWVPKSPALICDAAAAKRCDAATGTCKTLTTLGTTTPTGTYYQYAVFDKSAGVFKGGYDVDSDGDLLYINRAGTFMDVYKVTLLDSDNDGKLEPNQHPNNPNETGPIEKRELTFVKSYGLVNDKAPVGDAAKAELLAGPDRVFSLGPTRNGDITEYLLATQTTKVVAHPSKPFALSHLGFGAGESLWYGSNESARRVYSFCPSAKAWIAEFQYPDLAGSHMDGLEAIVSFSTGVQYVYVSDMTSDFIGQYRRDSKGGWVQENLFKYNDASSSLVEGMGYGALHHFWATGGDTVYEIGGGDLTGYLQ